MNSLNLWEWSQSKPLAIISMNDGGVQTENPEAICDLNSDFFYYFLWMIYSAWACFETALDPWFEWTGHVPQLKYLTVQLDRSKIHKSLKEHFLIRQNRTKCANFQGNNLFQDDYVTGKYHDSKHGLWVYVTGDSPYSQGDLGLSAQAPFLV